MSDEDENYEVDEADEDYQNYGESVLRQKIARFPPHESFDVSSFTQSKSGVDNPSKYIKGGFPISHAPTLQVSPESKINYLNNIGHQNTKSGHSALNQYSGRNKNDSAQQQQLDFLKRQLKQRQKRQDNYIAKIEELNNTNLALQKLIRDKDIIIMQKQELLLMQEKKFRQIIQNLNKNTSTLHKQKQKNPTSYIDQFCPELLSPDQSLKLFSQLLFKIEKSTNTKKKIMRDRKMIQSLNHILRQ